MLEQFGQGYRLARESDTPVTLNPSAAYLWSMFDGERSLGDIARQLRTEFPDRGVSLQVDLVDATRMLVERQLCRLVPAPAVPLDDAEVCILFAYHRDDDITRRHLDLLTWFNPHDPVVPVAVNAPRLLAGPPDTDVVDARRAIWDLSNPWRSLDAVYYRWFLQRRPRARRYVFIEYDTLVTTSIREGYAPVWDAAVAARDFHTPDSFPGWQWFAETPRMEPRDRVHAAGTVPLAGILLSHDALSRVVAAVTPLDLMSELRLGSTLGRLRIPVTRFPDALRATIDWRPQRFDLAAPGLFHPVKQRLQIPAPRRGPTAEPVVLVCPAGRRRYLGILLRYVDRLWQKSLIDRFDLWMNTAVEADLAWLRAVAAARPWVRLVYPDAPARGYGVGRFFRGCVEPGTVYVRVDDDVVFLDVDRFARFVRYRRAHPEWFLVFANTINNVTCSWLHQRFGAIGRDAGVATPEPFDPVAWSSGPFAELAHRALLECRNDRALDRFRLPNWRCEDGERVSTHVMAWRGEDFAAFGGEIPDDDDERWLSSVKPAELGRRNVIHGDMLAAHFAYGPQREYLDGTDLLQAYEKLAENA